MRLDTMTEQQARAARVALEQESAQRRHLVVYLSGAHAYGFPSPDSDVDLKAVHVAPTHCLVGLHPPAPHASRLEVIEGVEIDYTSNEIGPVLAGILSGNGNYLERILGRTWVLASPELESLRPLAASALSRKVYRHYAGFARGQRHALATALQPTAKKILYVLRTALTGTHLLRTGEMVIDVRELLDEYGLGAARELIALKIEGERIAVSDAERWRAELDRVMALLEAARDASCLPAEPRNVAPLDQWLLEVRRAFW